MKKLYFLIIKTIFFIIVFVSFSACSEDKRRLYYEAEGYGYVYDKDTKEPVPYAEINVQYVEKGVGWGSWMETPQVYFADETGFFKINFLKHAKGYDIIEYCVYSYINNEINFDLLISQKIYIKASNIKKLKSNKLNLDTLWLEKKLF